MQRAMFDHTMLWIIWSADRNVQGIALLRLPSPRIVHPFFPRWVPSKQVGDVLISYSISTPTRQTNFREMFTWCLREQTCDKYWTIALYHAISVYLFEPETINIVFCLNCVETKINTKPFI